jgi:hypothetical protein
MPGRPMRGRHHRCDVIELHCARLATQRRTRPDASNRMRVSPCSRSGRAIVQRMDRRGRGAP